MPCCRWADGALGLKADRDEARARHEAQGLTFLEVFMDVPITVVQERDPKGLYAKVINTDKKKKRRDLESCASSGCDEVRVCVRVHVP